MKSRYHSRIRSVTVLLSCFISLSMSMGVTAKEVSLITINQSYATPYGFVEKFAKDQGNNLNVRGIGVAGGALRWFYQNEDRNPDRLKPSVALKEKPYDFLNFTPLGPETDLGEATHEAVKAYYGMAVEQNPEVQAYISNRWPGQAELENREAWMAESMAAYEALADAATQAHGNPPERVVHIIPRAQAMMELMDRVLAGQIPGFTGMSVVYDDGGHPGTASSYMFATMEYGYLFGESPVGLSGKVPGSSVEEITFTPQQAEAMQRIGWHWMLQYPRSGVTLPEDSTPPSAPANLQAEDAQSNQVRLTWDAATDPESDVYDYLVRRDDGKEFSSLLPFYVDRAVEEGKDYAYQVIARNMLDMSGEPSAPLKVSTPLDTTPPTISRVAANETPQIVTVYFSEPLSEASLLPENFAVDPALPVSNVRVGASPAIAILTLDQPMQAGAEYNLQTRNLSDLARAANVAEPARTAFTFSPPEWKTFDLESWPETQVRLDGHSLWIKTQGDQSSDRDISGMAGVAKTLTGDFDFTVAVTSQAKSQRWEDHQERPGRNPLPRHNEIPKTGIVMVNDFASAQAENRRERTGAALLSIDENGRFIFEVSVLYVESWRSAVGKRFATEPREGGADFPVWLRLAREGDVLTGYYSTTGVDPEDWNKLADITLANASETVQLGLFNSSGHKEDPNIAMFDLRGDEQAKKYVE